MNEHSDLREAEQRLLDNAVEFIRQLDGYLGLKGKMAQMDDRQMLWLLEILFFEQAGQSFFGHLDAFICVVEERLYPEYDGDKVQMTDYGWQTPEGPIVYDQKKYHLSLAGQKAGNEIDRSAESRA